MSSFSTREIKVVIARVVKAVRAEQIAGDARTPEWRGVLPRREREGSNRILIRWLLFHVTARKTGHDEP